MNRGIYPILSGALAQERQMQVFSNNVANVNTAGFKQDESLFRSLVSRSMGNALPTGSSERVFVSSQGLKTLMVFHFCIPLTHDRQLLLYRQNLPIGPTPLHAAWLSRIESLSYAIDRRAIR